MWKNNETDDGDSGKLNSAVRPLAGEDIPGMLADLNEQCLALLAEQALHPMPSTPPMFRELVHLWSQLDATSRKRAAACPYLLMDAGFSDAYRWQWLSDQHANARSGVQDTRRAPVTLVKFFTAPSLIDVARNVFVNAWFIAQAHPARAPSCLGMPWNCVSLLRTCSMKQLMELADEHAGWLRPRWPGRPKIWRNLLAAGLSGEPESLQRAQLIGRQLLAMELRANERSKALSR